MLFRDFFNYPETKPLNELSQLDLTGAVSELNDGNTISPTSLQKKVKH